MSQIAEFHAAILQNLPELGSEVMQQWIGSERSSLRATLAQALAGTSKREYSQGASANILTVLPDLSFAERIQRGRYAWTNSSLTEKRFPVTANQVGEWECKLFHFNRNISSEEATRLIREDGFEPGKTGHILTFGETFPEEQQKYPIIALGSVAWVLLNRRVPALWDDFDKRRLILSWFGDDWFGHFRFLGVRQRSVA